MVKVAPPVAPNPKNRPNPPPDLARVAADWANLPHHVKAAILMLLDSAKK